MVLDLLFFNSELRRHQEIFSCLLRVAKIFLYCVLVFRKKLLSPKTVWSRFAKLLVGFGWGDVAIEDVDAEEVRDDQHDCPSRGDDS